MTRTHSHKAESICVGFLLILSVSITQAADLQKGLSALSNGDYATALSEWRPLAEQGNAAAQYNLGNLYYDGKGVPKDLKKAEYWYSKSSELGFADAQLTLGFMYANGQGVTQDCKRAIYWTHKAAEQGTAAAQTNLGNKYNEGKCVPQDYNQAVYWYTKAAEQGFDKAQNSLGGMYYLGQGVPKDNNQAIYWLTKAAEQGHANAQRNLASLANNGYGASNEYDQEVIPVESNSKKGQSGQYTYPAKQEEKATQPPHHFKTNPPPMYSPVTSYRSPDGVTVTALKRKAPAKPVEYTTRDESSQQYRESKPASNSLCSDGGPPPCGGWDDKAPNQSKGGNGWVYSPKNR